MIWNLVHTHTQNTLTHTLITHSYTTHNPAEHTHTHNINSATVLFINGLNKLFDAADLIKSTHFK